MCSAPVCGVSVRYAFAVLQCRCVVSMRFSKCVFLYCIKGGKFFVLGLLMARNHLARYFGHQSSDLPAILKDQHICKYCPYLKQCSLYHRYLNNNSVVLGCLCFARSLYLPMGKGATH